jgi:glutamate-ammonia-ligase adenylyltransferase
MPDSVRRLLEALESPVLAERLPVTAETFLARRAEDAALAALDGPALRGVARLLATSAEAARLLAARPEVLERVAAAAMDPAGALDAAGAALEAGEDAPEEPELEDELDELRLLRRQETVFAACLALGDAASVGDVSRFLSRLAETILRRALRRAEAGPGAGREAGPVLSVVGMGKIGGREFTFHSDLDVLFLYEGGPELVVRASRIAQRARACS